MEQAELSVSEDSTKVASLLVQELHDGLQDVVGILGNAAGIPHVGSSLHLSQDVSHLLHVLLYVRLETTRGNAEEAFSNFCTAAVRFIRRNDSVCLRVCFLLPDRENPAEIIHDVVELDLQVFQDVAGFHTQLKHEHGNTHTHTQSWLG